ncbi:hypothetical protein FGB62_2g516 [Gracilaria domingensis]|nr:hypothetical protein FGB62_2g516 [Gracilaria domingensis]
MRQLPAMSFGSYRDEMDLYPGGKNRPIQILVDESELSPEDRSADVSSVAKAWKAAHESLLCGSGFGMVVHCLTPSEYARISEYLDVQNELGDVETSLYTKHAPQNLEGSYRGHDGKASLIRLGFRTTVCEVLEALVLSQQYIVCRILERGLLENVKHVEEYKPSDELHVTTSVCCRFKICVNHMCGMEDFIRIVEGSFEQVNVEESRSALVSRNEILGKKATECWKWGWARNRREAKENDEDGLYVVYTLLPGRREGFFQDTIDKTGIYVTVSENVRRGFTGCRLGDTGRYYEYVAPSHPVEDNLTRKFWMPIGSTLVLSATSVVRFGGHWENDVEVYGYVLRARRLKRGAKMTYIHRDNLEEFDQLHEYGNDTEVLKNYKKSPGQSRKWKTFMERYPRERRVVVGTIPTVMEVELVGRGRKEMVSNMFDCLAGGRSIESVYQESPVLYLMRKEVGETYPDDKGKELRRMWLGGDEDEWMVDNVPFAYMEKLLRKRLSFPLDIAELRAAMLRALRKKPNGREVISDTESASEEGSKASVEMEDSGEGESEDSARHEAESGEGDYDSPREKRRGAKGANKPAGIPRKGSKRAMGASSSTGMKAPRGDTKKGNRSARGKKLKEKGEISSTTESATSRTKLHKK